MKYFIICLLIILGGAAVIVIVEADNMEMAPKRKESERLEWLNKHSEINTRKREIK